MSAERPTGLHPKPVLYAIVMGSPAARDIGKLVELAQQDGWEVAVIASPNGREFIDVDSLSAVTGHAVRSHYKNPDAPDILPPADAMIVAPITCNSLAKWAAGISDTLPLGCSWKPWGSGSPSWPCPSPTGPRSAFPLSGTP